MAGLRFMPSVFFDAEKSEEKSTGLIILNQPIHSLERLKTLWASSIFRICADGGANRLYDLVGRDSDMLPDLIHGDLDSLRNDIRKAYEARGVSVTFDGDQYSTDFAKAMKILTRVYDAEVANYVFPRARIENVVIMSTMSGRLDQAVGLLHEMYRETKEHSIQSSNHVKLWFVSEQSISFILPIGRNVISGIDPKNGLFRKHVGILPIYGPARISIQGFEWDVQDWETRMGGMVSTSNHVLRDEVVVEVQDEMVLFTIELAERE